MANFYRDTLNSGKSPRSTQPSPQQTSGNGAANHPVTNLDAKIVDEFQGRRHLRQDRARKCTP